jgi:hypothetical protein
MAVLIREVVVKCVVVGADVEAVVGTDVEAVVGTDEEIVVGTDDDGIVVGTDEELLLTLTTGSMVDGTTVVDGSVDDGVFTAIVTFGADPPQAGTRS